MILQGTMQDGTVIPVQVDAQGRLVAEGLLGPAGPRGEQGDPGTDGISHPLPPNPKEGKILGWSSGGLAWLDFDWPGKPIEPLAGTGYVPSDLGSPYLIDVLPANGTVNQGGFGNWKGPFNANTSDYLQIINNQTTSVRRFRVDLRDWIYPGVSQTITFYAEQLDTVFTWDWFAKILDKNRTQIQDTKRVGSSMSVGTSWTATDVRFLEFEMTGAATQNNHQLRFKSLVIDTMTVVVPKMAITTNSATPF